MMISDKQSVTNKFCYIHNSIYSLLPKIEQGAACLMEMKNPGTQV